MNSKNRTCHHQADLVLASCAGPRVAVLHEAGGRRPSIMEILNIGPENRLFQTAEEVKAYLAEKKESWDRLVNDSYSGRFAPVTLAARGPV